MKESEVDNSVSNAISLFENIGELKATEAWQQSLMDRVTTAKSVSSVGFPKKSFTVVMLFVLLINAGFILNSVFKTSTKSSSHKSELQLISKELLINEHL